MMTSDWAVETRAVSKVYGGFRALDSVDLAVVRGSIHGLIGPNGAGKTTLVGVIMGYLRPTAGRVVIDGRDVTRSQAWARVSMGVGRSFQVPEIFRRMSVRDNVQVALLARNRSILSSFTRPHLGERTKTDAIVRELHLERVADVGANEISHGDRKKLELAMALALSPSILVLDEPAAGMGHHEVSEFIEMLRLLRDARELTIIVVEHDLRVIFELANALTVLHAGKVIFTGSVADAVNDHAVKDAYLGAQTALAVGDRVPAS